MKHSSSYQDLVQRSEARGELHGRLNLLQRQVHHRFGSLPEGTEQAMATLDVQKLDQLGEALLDFTSASDLALWLEQHQQ